LINLIISIAYRSGKYGALKMRQIAALLFCLANQFFG